MMADHSEKFSIRARMASFKYALRGMLLIMKKEHNIWIQLILSAIAIVLGFIFHISKTDWLLVILCIGLVLSAEIINTAVEELIDLISPQKNDRVGIIKDIAAGAVLVAAIAAFIIGILVFLPYMV
jgi:diacylglycerol kinase (ATP)